MLKFNDQPIFGKLKELSSPALNTAQAKPEPEFSLEELSKTYKKLEDEVKKWEESPNYLGTDPSDGKFFTFECVTVLMWLDPIHVDRINFRLALPSANDTQNEQDIEKIKLYLEKHGVIKASYG